MEENGLRNIMVFKKKLSSSIPPMVHEDYHWKSAYTWMRGGEGSLSPGLLPPPLLSQPAQPDDTLHPQTVGQTWREGNNQGGND